MVQAAVGRAKDGQTPGEGNGVPKSRGYALSSNCNKVLLVQMASPCDIRLLTGRKYMSRVSAENDPA